MAEADVASTGNEVAPDSVVYLVDAQEFDDIERTDFAGATDSEDDTASTELVESLPESTRLDFLAEFCDEGSLGASSDRSAAAEPDACFRDAMFPIPPDTEPVTGEWQSGRAFHVRQGFPVTDNQPLGDGFDVTMYVTRNLLDDDDNGYPANETLRFESDHRVHGETDQCGPAYRSQTGPVTCEWFVHEFPDGLPEGRYELFAVWEAPCSYWNDVGLAVDCDDPTQVISAFSSGVDSPFHLDPFADP